MEHEPRILNELRANLDEGVLLGNITQEEATEFMKAYLNGYMGRNRTQPENLTDLEDLSA